MEWLFGFTPLVIIAAIAAAFFQRGREKALTSRDFLRGYLYLASLAGVVMFVVGLAALISFVIAQFGGSELVYGGSGAAAPCLAGERCPQPPDRTAEIQRRHAEDLVRGLTYVTFGALLWVAHWLARRSVITADEAKSQLGRGYLMVGTAIFGLTTIIALPVGIYELLAAALIPRVEGSYRPPIEELSAGLAALPVWLIYLRLLVRDFRTTSAAS